MTRQLFDATGKRKYLTPAERDAFLKAAEKAPREVRTFGGVLAHTGCRLSEALALAADRVDLAAGVVILESLKKRQRGVYRAVPVPPALLDALDVVHGVREAQHGRDAGRNKVLWTWGRTTAWKRVKEVMEAAGIPAGPWASPKGLRHGFGAKGVTSPVPLNLVQRWLGHAQVATTAIYADAVGEEERTIAARLW